MVAALCAALLSPLILWATLPSGSGAAGVDGLEGQVEGHRQRERGLAADAAGFARLERELSGDIALLERRLAAVQADLDEAQAQLRSSEQALRRQRGRLARLKGRLAHGRRTLELRLVEIYKAGRPDVITVVVTADGFADLLERAEFLRRIEAQDARVIVRVRTARIQSAEATRKLAVLTDRRRRAALAIERRRNALASMRDALAAKRASYARARAARIAALNRTRGARRRLEKELDKLLAERGAGASSRGPGGPWAIPWAIVQCESGGQNMPPNSAGASGYYQIIPSTWKGFGGSGPHAYLTGKGEQDRVATRIWDGGRGARNWDCYALVH